MLAVVKDALAALAADSDKKATDGSENTAENTSECTASNFQERLLASAGTESMPRGGFTDVGQHTGGDAVRDTAWPLVRAVIQVLL